MTDQTAPERELPNAQIPVTFQYTNWRNETARRTAIPKRLWFGRTEWHPVPGWMLTAFDIEKQADRDFALTDCDFSGPKGEG